MRLFVVGVYTDTRIYSICSLGHPVKRTSDYSVFVPGTVATSGDTFGCHSWGRALLTSGRYRSQKTTKQPATNRTAPHSKQSSSKRHCSNPEEKPVRETVTSLRATNWPCISHHPRSLLQDTQVRCPKRSLLTFKKQM